MTKHRIGAFVIATVVGAIAAFGLTVLVYGTFFQNFLEQFNELTPEATALISRDSINMAAIILANLAHGILLATVISWGRFHTPLRGAGAGAGIAFLTEVYFLFNQHAIFKTMSLPSAIWDTIVWTVVNAVVGALVAWILHRLATRRTAAVTPHATT